MGGGGGCNIVACIQAESCDKKWGSLFDLKKKMTGDDDGWLAIGYAPLTMSAAELKNISLYLQERGLQNYISVSALMDEIDEVTKTKSFGVIIENIVD